MHEPIDRARAKADERRIFALLAGLGLALAGCSSGQPSPAATTTPSPVPLPPSSTVAPSATTPAPKGATLHLLPEEGRAAGMPAIGFTLRDVWQGFARSSKPVAGTYLSLGGPPGG